jgi:stringent starvation protein B
MKPPPGKKQTLLAYLEAGIAMLHLDARRPGVQVPEQHAEDAHLRLNLSYRYGIPDLVVDAEKVQATLSFRGRAFQCVIPWGAVFGITSQTSGEGQVWPEDLPVEVMSALEHHQPGGTEGQDQRGESGETVAGGKPARPTLAAVEEPAAGKPAPRRRRAPERKRPSLAAVPAEPAPQAEAQGQVVEPAPAPGQHSPPEPAEPISPPSDGARRGHLRLVR